MSLAKRLAAVIPEHSKWKGCGTCRWIEDLSAEDSAALHAWINEQRSLNQLWEIASREESNPYRLSLASFRTCIRTHHRTSDES